MLDNGKVCRATQGAGKFKIRAASQRNLKCRQGHCWEPDGSIRFDHRIFD